MEKLCDDISCQILIRLPSRNIAKLRCVCKRWNTRLSEANFIKSHLIRSINNNDKDEILLLLNYGSKRIPFEAISTASPDVELINFIKIPVNFPSKEAKGGKFTVIGAANGLVCFSIGYANDRVIHVWNPSLSALLTVPQYAIPVPSRNPGAPYYTDYNFRFGFDPKNDDYKIFKLIRVRNIEWLQVEVYSMRSGCWKLINQRFPSCVSELYSNRVHVCVDGHLHMLCFNGDLKIETIVAYDLAAESFSEISLLDGTKMVDYNHLGVFGGNLCVISGDGYVDYCRVWVLDQYGSWVNSGFSHFHNGGIFPYGFTLKNKFIYEAYCDYKVIHLYDPAAPFDKVKRHISNPVIIPYVESLVWVTPPSPATC